ncbi:MAG: GH3 auxin-responsive promoter family protein [Candidatus Omnitrophota bacterium]
MNIAYLAVKLLAFKAMAFERSTKDPVRAQKKILLEFLKRNRNTEYGRRYDFSSIRSIADYQNTVPVNDFETFLPYLEKMEKGEDRVLTVDKPIFFGATSGTTSRKKLIPVTGYSREKKAEVSTLWSYYISRDHPRVLDGKVLAVISPEIEGYTGSGLPYGAESGFGYRNLPIAVKSLYALPHQVFEIKDYDARYYCILRIGIEQNITTVATLNPSTLVLLCKKIEIWKDKIIDDIERGSLNKEFDISENIRREIEAAFRPNPARAAVLKDILKERGALLPKYFWPGLELIECWKGGTVKIYLKELPQYFGDVPIRDFGCLSTEARSSIPMSDEGAGGVLAINANFYEFIPREDMSKKDKRVFLCDELEKGREYLLVVTTPGGLYRYNIDDVIVVDGFFNKTPVIEFVQKGLNAVSLTGEKVYESQVNEAVNKALDAHKMIVELFSASVQWDHPPRYIFLVEFDGVPTLEEKKGFLKSIEEELCRQNCEYSWIRQAQLLGSPLLKVVKSGEFERYRAKKISEGAHDTQFKLPELSGDFTFQDNFKVEENISIE